MDRNTQKIRDALSALDPEDAELWTAEGLPRVEVVAELSELPGLKRSEITAAAPQFTRERPVLDLPDAIGPETDAEDLPPEEPPSADPMSQAEADLAQAEAEIRQAEAEFNAAQRKLAAAQAARDRLVAAAAARRDPHANQKAISRYLERQNQIRVARGEQRARVQAAGIKLEDLVPPPAPIDAAMRRKTGFGRERPSRPLMQ